MELIVTPNLIQVYDQSTSWLYFHISETHWEFISYQQKI